MKSLFDDQGGVDAAIEAATVHAGDGWKAAAETFMRSYCETHEFVFIDEVRDAPGWPGLPAERGRAAGWAVRRAAAAGWMEKIPCSFPGTFVSRPSKHSNKAPKWVWRSLVYGHGRAAA